METIATKSLEEKGDKKETKNHEMKNADLEPDIENLADNKIASGEKELKDLEYGRDFLKDTAKRYDLSASDLYNRFDKKCYAIYEKGNSAFENMAEK